MGRAVPRIVAADVASGGVAVGGVAAAAVASGSFAVLSATVAFVVLLVPLQWHLSLLLQLMLVAISY